MTMMQRFTLDVLRNLAGDDRLERLAELEQHLTDRLRPADDFDREVDSIVRSLREVGHDLWSWDCDDDSQIWGPDYRNRPTLMGIIIHFRVPCDVEVSWVEDADPAPIRAVFGQDL